MSCERIELGLVRLTCDCDGCKACCRCLPGNLIPSDLTRLIPVNAEPYSWAFEHLQADIGGCLKTASKPDGSCHWFRGGLCEVWADAPFGCAYFGCHKVQSDSEADVAQALGVGAIQVAMEDEASLYRRLWEFLWRNGKRRTMEDKVKAMRKLHKLAKRVGK